ncbi:unnamed protein product [Rhodiola kirilowii]
MKVKNWLRSNHSNAVDGGATPSYYSSSATSTPSTVSSYGSLQSNLSLQTLPSVRSLQTTLSPESSLNLSVTHTLTSSLRHHNQTISSLAVDGNLLYSASGNQISIYDISDPKTLIPVNSFNANDSASGSVKSLAFCNNGNVISSHQSGKIKVWRFEKQSKKHKLVATLPTVNDKILRLLLPGSYVKVRRHKTRMWIEHNDAVSGLAVAENLICSVSWDKSLKIWRPSDFKCQQSIPAHEDAVNAVVLSQDGIVYTGCADGRIRVWNQPEPGSRSGNKYGLISTLEKHKSAVNALALSADGGTLFSGACDRSILVWEREDSSSFMAVSGALRGHAKAILCLVCHGDMLISGSADRTVRIWAKGAVGRFCCLAVLDGHRSPVKSIVAVSGSGGAVSVYSGGLDGEIRVWEVTVSDLVKNSSSVLSFNER